VWQIRIRHAGIGKDPSLDGGALADYPKTAVLLNEMISMIFLKLTL
jgi:hypothetical protein